MNKSITELCKCMHSVKSESVENMEAILSTIEQHHNDNNQFSSRIADLNEKMLRMQELITRYKDENYQIKSINAELVSENTHLKARNVKPVKNVQQTFLEPVEHVIFIRRGLSLAPSFTDVNMEMCLFLRYCSRSCLTRARVTFCGPLKTK